MMTDTNKATTIKTTATTALEVRSAPKPLRVRTGIKVGPIFMNYEGIKGA